MEITLQDIAKLQQEAGKAENDLRLRAIMAERRVRELEAQVEVLQKQNEPQKEL